MGVLNIFKMADCGPTEFFKMADLFITEDLYRLATVHEDRRKKEQGKQQLMVPC